MSIFKRNEESRENQRFGQRDFGQRDQGRQWNRDQDYEESEGQRQGYREEGDFGQKSGMRSSQSNMHSNTGYRGTYNQDFDPSRSATGYGSQSYGSQGQGYGSQSWDDQNHGSHRFDSGYTTNRTNRNSSEGSFGTGTQLGSQTRTQFGQGSHFGKGPKNYRRSDERIQEEVCETLWQHGEIDATEMDVTVEGGVVTLSGTVEDRQTRRNAEMAIENIPGVLDVRNQLTISKSETGFGMGVSKSKGLEGSKGDGSRTDGSKSRSPSGSKSTSDMM